MSVNEHNERLDLLVASAAYRCRRRWSHMDIGDLRGEMYLWLYQNPAKVLDLLAREDIDQADRDLTSYLLNAGELVARRERAAIFGYEAQDEFFYSTAALRDMLPVVLDPTSWVLGAGTTDVRVSAGPPAHEGGNWTAMLADISQALGQLRQHDRDMLTDRYGYGDLDEASCAERLGISPDALRARTNRAIGRLRRALGGKRPDQQSSERQYTGSRRSLSNAAALALTNHQEDQ